MCKINRIKSLKDDIEFLRSFKDFREDVQPDPDLIKALNTGVECMEKELKTLLEDAEIKGEKYES